MRKSLIILLVLLLTAGLVFAGGKKEAGKIVLMTAGDTNMLAIQQNVLGPQFAALNPGTGLISVHTGPGNAGSQRIYEKLLAES